MKTKIFLVRHGESLGNAARRILGHTDLDLSELGYAQAESTAKALANEKIDVVYSSDLMRAMNTAAPHARIRGLTVVPDRNLREMYVGEWEGKSVSDVKEQYGTMYDEQWRGGFGTFVFPGGEGTQEAAERFYGAMKDIADKNSGKAVLVAAHAAVIRAFWAKISGIKPEDIAASLDFPTNASYSVLEYEGGAFCPLEFSVDGHLAEVGITRV